MKQHHVPTTEIPQPALVSTYRASDSEHISLDYEFGPLMDLTGSEYDKGSRKAHARIHNPSIVSALAVRPGRDDAFITVGVEAVDSEGNSAEVDALLSPEQASDLIDELQSALAEHRLAARENDA